MDFNKPDSQGAEQGEEALPREWVELALQDAPVRAPDADARARMKDRIRAKMQAPSLSAKTTLGSFMRIDEQEGWKRLHDKAEKKVLFNDGTTVTWLLRLAPGGSVLPHGHDKGVEECLVMQGSVLLNGELFRAGDYQLASEGTRHEEVLSVEGCVVMLRSPASRERELAMLSAYSNVAEPVSKAGGAIKRAAHAGGEFVRSLVGAKSAVKPRR
jgi:ChrR Cupin-like domain